MVSKINDSKIKKVTEMGVKIFLVMVMHRGLYGRASNIS